MGKYIKQLAIPAIGLCFLMCAGSGRKLDELDLARKIIGE